MSTTGNVNFNVVNDAYEPATPAVGILYFEGVTKRGPSNDPSTLITTPKQFRNLFGNIDITSDFPLLAYRAMQKGAVLRVNRILGAGSAIAESSYVGHGVRGVIGAPTFVMANVTPLGEAQGQVDSHTPANVAIGDIFKITLDGANPLYFKATAATAANVIAGFIAAIAAEKIAHPTGAWAVKEVATFDGTTFLRTTTKVNVAATYVDTVAAVPHSLFKIYGKYAGEDYNNILVTIKAATNTNADYFNLEVTLTNDALVIEKFENLKVVNASIAGSTYLDIINTQSNLISIQYADTSAFTYQLRPTNSVYSLAGGADGGAPVLADYVGDQAAGTGFYAFDPFEDSYALACPEISEDDLAGISVAGEAYATLRKDLRYYQHLDNTNTTAALLIAEKPSIDSPAIIFTAGGLSITHPISSLPVEISELADVLGNMAHIHRVYKVWTAFFGPDYGVLNNCLGVVNNFGAPAKFLDLDLLAQNRINMVIKRAGKTMLWDDYTSQVDPSPENFACLENLIIYLQKILGPVLEKFLGKPTDFQLLRDIYFSVKPIIDDVQTGRGISSYLWQGDQFATAFADLEVNTAADMALGKTKMNLRIVCIAPLKEISVSIILTKAGVTFETN